MPRKNLPKLRLRGEDDVVSYSALPSWTLSVALHVLLILFLLSWGSGHAAVGDGDSDFSEVGLVLKNSADAPVLESTQSSGVDETLPEVPRLDKPIDPTAADAVPDEAPAIKPDLPAKHLIGPGPAQGAVPLPAGTLAGSQKTPQNAGSPSEGLALGSPGGENGIVPFFQIKAQGSRVVYVIDCSGSMSNHDAMGVARTELLASLQHINSKKEFQIVFYNTKLHPMIHPDGKKGLVRGTEINQTLARQFINGIQPDGGTDHLIALKFALGLKPDTVFFLTDAQEPQLTAGELNQIKVLNQGHAKIHAIEFGKGPPLSVTNFLKKLAQQNDGSYRYRDVTTFDRNRGLE
jgi:Ca-activated chloride channel family protein